MGGYVEALFLPLSLSLSLSVYIYIYVYIYIHIRIHLELSYLPICLSTYLPIYPSIYLSVCIYAQRYKIMQYQSGMDRDDTEDSSSIQTGGSSDRHSISCWAYARFSRGCSRGGTMWAPVSIMGLRLDFQKVSQGPCPYHCTQTASDRRLPS